jgi:hypothetical protein
MGVNEKVNRQEDEEDFITRLSGFFLIRMLTGFFHKIMLAFFLKHCRIYI